MVGPFRNGDIVGVVHQGREFMAMVDREATPQEHKAQGEDVTWDLKVVPLTKNVTHFHILRRSVRTHWRRGRGATPRVRLSDAGTFAGVTYSGDR